jgi:hypothetical protein
VGFFKFHAVEIGLGVVLDAHDDDLESAAWAAYRVLGGVTSLGFS